MHPLGQFLVPYRDSLFVNRHEAIEQVVKLVRSMLEARLNKISSGSARLSQNPDLYGGVFPIGNSNLKLLTFTGERGSGKSWLAIHLHRTVMGSQFHKELDSNRLVSFLISFDPQIQGSPTRQEYFWEDDGRTPESALLAMMTDIGASLSCLKVSSPSIIELGEHIATCLGNDREGKCLVLFLDSMYELFVRDFTLFDLIQDNIIHKLIWLDNVAIVMTGRTKIPPWKLPYLRKASEGFVLGPFNRQWIQAQAIRVNGYLNAPAVYTESDANPIIDSQRVLIDNDDPKKAERASDVVARVVELSDGTPLHSHLLLSLLLDELQGKTILSEQAVALVLNKLGTILLEDDVDLRIGLEAICILDSFRLQDSWLERLLKCRYNQLGLIFDSESLIADFIKKLKSSPKVQLAPHQEEHMFHLDNFLRTVLESHLRIQSVHDWIELHRVAAEQFNDWINQYPESRTIFEPRKTYHEAQTRLVS